MYTEFSEREWKIIQWCIVSLRDDIEDRLNEPFDQIKYRHQYENDLKIVNRIVEQLEMMLGPVDI